MLTDDEILQWVEGQTFYSRSCIETFLIEQGMFDVGSESAQSLIDRIESLVTYTELDWF